MQLICDCGKAAVRSNPSFLSKEQTTKEVLATLTPLPYIHMRKFISNIWYRDRRDISFEYW